MLIHKMNILSCPEENRVSKLNFKNSIKCYEKKNSISCNPELLYYY